MFLNKSFSVNIRNSSTFNPIPHKILGITCWSSWIPMCMEYFGSFHINCGMSRIETVTLAPNKNVTLLQFCKKVFFFYVWQRNLIHSWNISSMSCPSRNLQSNSNQSTTIYTRLVTSSTFIWCTYKFQCVL